MKIIDKLAADAQKFMDKQKYHEKKKRNEINKLIEKLFKMIYTLIKGRGKLSLSYINSFLENEIYPLIEQIQNEMDIVLDEEIRRNFELGITQGSRFLNDAEGFQIPDEVEIKTDENYTEILAVLLLFGTQLNEALFNDLKTKLKSDIYSIYITNKNLDKKFDAEKEIKTDDNKLINTAISGAVISKYISNTFKNISNRADMIIMNEINRSLNYGLNTLYFKQGKEYVYWKAIHDERLCKHCDEASRHNNGIYHIDDVDPPPLHSRCRCILIPYDKRYDMEN